MKYAIIGSSISGNKGAAAMLEASIQSLSQQDPEASFTLFSVYPKADSKQNHFKNLTILPTVPLALGLWVNPLALLYKCLPPFRPLLGQQRHLKSLKECDAFLDQGGITFVDGRSLFLLYNVASILPAVWLGKPIVKCSQALGPFNNLINRLLAKNLLPKMALILARGRQTLEHLNTLKLKNVKLVADYAFALVVDNEAKAAAQKLLASHKISKAAVGVCPSQVVKTKFEKAGGDYAKVMADFINSLNEPALLFAHSARLGSSKTHNNDLPVCAEIYAHVRDKQKCVFLDQELPPQQLRYIISTLKLCVVSRFHAMIAALSVATPLIVVGWSHKYQEVLAEFEQEKYAIDLGELSSGRLKELYQKALADLAQNSKTIASHSQTVKKNSLQNTSEILRVAREAA